VGRSAMKVAYQRRSATIPPIASIDGAQPQVSLRRLAQPTRSGEATEPTLDETIAKPAANAEEIEIVSAAKAHTTWRLLCSWTRASR